MIPFRFVFPKGMTWNDVREFVRFMMQRLGQARLQQVAGNLTFVTLLAVVPLMMIALALFTQFPMFGTLRDSLEAYFAQAMLPKQVSNTILGYLTRFASKAAHMSAFGVIGLVAGAVMMVGMIERSFNQIWRIRKQRSVPRRIVLYITVAVLGPFVFGISLSMTMQLYIATGGTLKNPSFFDSALFTLLSVIWNTGAFALLYVIIPNRTIHWREAVCGALFAAIAFEIAKRIFTLMLVQFPTYRTIYGAVAAVPTFLAWIYLSWLITLAGAALTAAIHFVWHSRWRNARTTGGAFPDAVAILGLLHHARQSGAFGVEEAAMRRKTGFGLDEIENLLYAMKAAGWVERVRPDTLERIKERKLRADASDYWRLLADPQQLTLADVYRLFVFDSSGDAPLAKKAGAAIAQGLSETLAAHCAQDDANSALP